MNTPVQSSFEHLQEIIEDIRFAMFTTRSAEGALHARPMTTQRAKTRTMDEHDKLWFFMSRSSEPVAELLADPRVNVSYADSRHDTYVSVCGMASVTDAMHHKERFWNTMAEAWFPGGIEDPELTMVCVQIETAEYWNVKEGKLTQIAKMVKAALTGKPPNDMGEHGKVE